MERRTLLTLDDPIWATLQGGYRLPYDATPALRELEAGEDSWHELWEELHHQGDVGEASYAAVPQLVRIAAAANERTEDVYALCALIELERHRKHNPPLPDWLRDSYHSAWSQLAQLAARELQATPDTSMLNALFAVLAMSKGELKLGALLMQMDSSETDDWLEQHLGWSELYE